jgi:hypothetical protein
MNTATQYDYAAQVRERQAKEEREAAALCLTVRGVARLLGGRYLDETPGQSCHTIELAPTVHLWARRDWRPKGMIHWGASCPLASIRSVQSVRTRLGRAVPAIAADLKRRLVPAAFAACKQAMSAAAEAKDKERARDAQLAQLEEILGPLRNSHDRAHYDAHGFCVRRDELLAGAYPGCYRAEVRVRSWHCLLMIAKLVAEDARVAAILAEKSAEQREE